MAKAKAAELIEPEPGPWSAVDLFGHGEAEAQMLHAYQSGRMPHAFMISGPRGIGKATFAYRFARFMLSQGGDAGPSLFGDDTPIDSLWVAPDSSTFLQIAGRGHPGLVTVARSVNEKTKKLRGDIVVDDVRKMQGMFTMTSAQDSWRIAIIDAGDEMTRQAANALLKTLEEPPERSLLMVVAHAPGQVLMTIKSRCQHLRLRPLDATNLAAVLASQDVDIPAGSAELMAVLSEGRPGQAINLAQAGGLELYASLRDLIGSGSRVDMRAVHALGDKVGRAGAEDTFRLFAELFEGFLQRLIRSVGGTPEGSPSIDKEAVIFASLLEATPLEQWIEVWENSRQLFARTMAVNLDRKQAVIIAFNEVQKLLR
jgi:DNA polymerase-3 subunit delta'